MRSYTGKRVFRPLSEILLKYRHIAGQKARHFFGRILLNLEENSIYVLSTHCVRFMSEPLYLYIYKTLCVNPLSGFVIPTALYENVITFDFQITLKHFCFCRFFTSIKIYRYVYKGLHLRYG